MRYALAALVAAILSLITLPALADTTGVVRGTATLAGKPVAGLTITLKGEGASQTAVTDSAGQFTFARVPFGHYVINAQQGSNDALAQLDVETDAVAIVTLDLRPLHEIGRTQNSYTRGVGSAPVSVNSLSKSQIAALPNNQSLNNLIETVPGIVRFSYNEPVAHGFHGVTYEIDGVPLPFGTTSNFSEVIDPRSIDSIEVITGAMPAEFGGTRQGAVINIISHRATDLDVPEQGSFTLGGGTYAEAQSSLTEALRVGSSTKLFLNVNEERSARGLDSPTFDPNHDNNNQANEFLRTITNLSARDSLSFDFSNNFAAFQVPINANPNDLNDPVVVPPGTDDVQREYDRFVNLSFTHNTADGTGYTQISPWYRSDRVVYDGDLQNDLLGYFNNGGGSTTPLDGLRQDRSSDFIGLRLTQARIYGPNSVKAGVDGSIENFTGTSLIEYHDPNIPTQIDTFTDNAAKRGTQLGAYVEDKWTPTTYFSVFGGLRYDRSTGYVDGGQLSPRIEVNGQVDPKNILHFFYGRTYAAPFIEDTRRAAVVLGGGNPNQLPVYDLQPERDSYYEFGIAHTISSSVRSYLNFWKRDATNVLDTTQIFPTPIFAVYNNTIGIAKGVEGRIDARLPGGDSLFFTANLSQALAGGISGGTFLFPPGSQSVTLNPEDHDQTFASTFDYTHRFGGDRSFFASLEPQYGTGYPVQFQNGSGRLPPHLTLDASLGREAAHGHLGFVADVTNLANTKYLLKINNGFNTTQYGPGTQFTFRLIAPF